MVNVIGSIKYYPKNKHIDGVGVICWYCPLARICQTIDNGAFDEGGTYAYGCINEKCIVEEEIPIKGYEYVKLTAYGKFNEYIVDSDNKNSFEYHKKVWNILTKEEKELVKNDLIKRMYTHTHDDRDNKFKVLNEQIKKHVGEKLV